MYADFSCLLYVLKESLVVRLSLPQLKLSNLWWPFVGNFSLRGALSDNFGNTRNLQLVEQLTVIWIFVLMVLPWPFVVFLCLRNNILLTMFCFAKSISLTGRIFSSVQDFSKYEIAWRSAPHNGGCSSSSCCARSDTFIRYLIPPVKLYPRNFHIAGIDETCFFQILETLARGRCSNQHVSFTETKGR